MQEKWKFLPQIFQELLTQMWQKQNKYGCQIMNTRDIGQIICVHMHSP